MFLSRALLLTICILLSMSAFSHANSAENALMPTQGRVAVISVADQKMIIKDNGKVLREFPVSTSKFGLGDRFNSFRTPLGQFEVAQRIGHNVPIGGIFNRRQFTGKYYDITDRSIERLARDSILSRIIWLRGLEEQNRNAYHRGIYIHGTNQESLVGRPVSYGCIRMRNRDVVEAFDLLREGSRVVIKTDPLPRLPRERAPRPDRNIIPDPEPATPPVVPEEARLVASASERGSRSPTILRSLTRQAANTSATESRTTTSSDTPPLINTSATTTRQPAAPKNEIVRSNVPQQTSSTTNSSSASRTLAIPAEQIDEGWALDSLAQRRAEARRQASQ